MALRRSLFFLPFIILLLLPSCTKEYIYDIEYTVKSVNLPAPVSSNITAVLFLTENTGFIGTQAGEVYKTIDQGITWSSVNQFSQGLIHKFYFIDASNGFACTSGGLYATHNGGTSWAQVQYGNFWSVDFVSPSVGYAVGSDGIYRTSYGGDYWEQAYQSAIFPEMHSVAFKDASNGQAVADDGSIVSTTDGGNTWRDGEGSSSLRALYAIQWDGTRYYYAGTQGQFYVSNDQDGREVDAEAMDFVLRAIDTRGNIGVVVGENSVLIGDLDQTDFWQYHYRTDASTFPYNFNDVSFCSAQVFIAVGDNGIITKFTL